MNILRNEIRTGLLVVISLAVLTVVVLYLGAPGVFSPQTTYRIYLDNAAGIKQGGDVLLAGRKVGRVTGLFSPVPEAERPEPKHETLVEIAVSSSALIYKDVRVLLTQNGLLGEMLIDFTSGREASGRAEHNQSFVGERTPGLTEAVPQVLAAIDPALRKATATLDSLSATANNLTALTGPDSDLPKAIAEYKAFGANLKQLSGPEGSLHKTLANLEEFTGETGKVQLAVANVQKLTGDDSPLARTMKNAEKFTSELANNNDIEGTLRNFRSASEKLNQTMDSIGPQFSEVGRNLAQASETVKRQPWRLIWPSTKKYEDDGRASPPQPRLQVPVRRAVAVKPSKKRR